MSSKFESEAEATPNPILELAPFTPDKLERGESIKTKNTFKAHLKDAAESATEKGIGKGVDAKDAVNVEALTKLMSGGGLGGTLETISIAIGYLQNFGLVGIIEIAWPESWVKLFAWLEIFGLDLSFWGDMGAEVSVATGLILPFWLIWEFDCGLFKERKLFRFAWANDDGEIKHTRAKRWFTSWGLVSIYLVALGVAGASGLRIPSKWMNFLWIACGVFGVASR
ncbi:hypothetical protein TrVE_jg9391 [Triparma verrucosa]|uniref:Uncharacterized protein n=1 Tax=Triparma verrucosa TaxID=1606542 RepID=A0A9W7C840_9STRA|nr:hypothetical protein TrVE_jg9391 [Triparma verrucosa]